MALFFVRQDEMIIPFTVLYVNAEWVPACKDSSLTQLYYIDGTYLQKYNIDMPVRQDQGS